MTRAKFKHPLGLSAYEWRALSGAHQGLVRTGINTFLVGTTAAHRKAAESLIARGYARKVKAQFSPNFGWPVIKITKATTGKYNGDVMALGKRP